MSSGEQHIRQWIVSGKDSNGKSVLTSGAQILTNHTNQAMLICQDILQGYQEHGHDFEWQKHLLPRLYNLQGSIRELIIQMEQEFEAHKELRKV